MAAFSGIGGPSPNVPTPTAPIAVGTAVFRNGFLRDFVSHALSFLLSDPFLAIDAERLDD